MQNIAKKLSLWKVIIFAVVFLLIICLVYVLSIDQHTLESDPASDAVILQEAAIQLNKFPNNLTDEDFTKINELWFGNSELSDFSMMNRALP